MNVRFFELNSTYRIMMVRIHVSDDTVFGSLIFGCLIAHIVYMVAKYTWRGTMISTYHGFKDPEDQIRKRAEVEAPLLTRWS